MEEISSSGGKHYSCLLHFFRLNAVNESDHIWDQMNAPGQTLTFSPEIEWSELLCVSFPSLFAPLLFLWCVQLIVKNGKSRKEKEKKERKKYKPTLNWQGSNSRLSVSCHGLKPPLPPFPPLSPLPPLPPPLLHLRQLRFFGREEKFGQSQFLKKFPCFFYLFEERYFLF